MKSFALFSNETEFEIKTETEILQGKRKTHKSSLALSPIFFFFAEHNNSNKELESYFVSQEIMTKG